MTTANLIPAAQSSLETWHQMLANGSMAGLDAIVADEVVFRSPVAHTPYPAAPPLHWC